MFNVPPYYSIFTSSILALFFWLAAYFVSKNKDSTFVHQILVGNWIVVGTIFFLIAISSTVFRLFPELYTIKILEITGAFFVLQAFMGITYALLKTIRSSKFIFIILLFIAIFLGYFLYNLCTQGTLQIRNNEPFLAVNGSLSQQYGFGVAVLSVIILGITALLLSVKEKGIDFFDSSDFYKDSAFLLFWGISLLRVLYVIPGGFFSLLILYSPIPILSYISFKKSHKPSSIE